MKIIKTKFSNLLIFQGKKNKDSRGHLVEIFKQNLIKNKLKFDYFTTSKKNVLRGMHFQLKKQQDKLITVIKGKIIDFSIDLRKNSKTFGKIFLEPKISDEKPPRDARSANAGAGKKAGLFSAWASAAVNSLFVTGFGVAIFTAPSICEFIKKIIALI